MQKSAQAEVSKEAAQPALKVDESMFANGGAGSLTRRQYIQANLEESAAARSPATPLERAARKFAPKPGEVEPKWGKYLEDELGVAKPADMENAHAHHTVMKAGLQGRQREWVERSKDILEHYDIDWDKGPENLSWAPNGNGVHTTSTVRVVHDEPLRAHEELGTKDAISETLRDLQQRLRTGGLK